MSTTEHSAFRTHGLVSMHGFLQVPLKQASFDGQSASCVHSGALTTGAKKNVKKI